MCQKALTRSIPLYCFIISGHSAQERSVSLRQMAEIHSSAKTKGCSPDQTEDPSSSQPVLPDPGQTDRYGLTLGSPLTVRSLSNLQIIDAT